MAEIKTPTPPDETDAGKKSMTAAAAAKRVKRTVQVRDGDQVVDKRVPVGAEEVLAFRDYGTHVVVVTKDGQKLTDADAAAD